MSKKTVLHICNYSAPYTGNFIASLSALSRYAEVDNVFLFPYCALTSGAKEWIDELNKNGTCAYIQDKNLVLTFFLLKKIIKSHHVDKIITHFSDMKADLLIKLAVNKKKVIRFFHNTYRSSKNYRHYIRSFLWNGNLLVGVSNYVSQQLRKTFPKQKVVTVVNAISFERLNVVKPFEKKGEIVATIMGWDAFGKGLDIALKAIDKLQTTYPITLQVIAAKNDKRVMPFVQSTIGKEVTWVVVLPPENAIATYLNATDIFLSPSRAEAFGYSVVEAAYCGANIVASRVDGQAELKIKTIHWFESKDVDDMSRQIEKCILEIDDPKAVSLRSTVKKDVQELYSLKEWSKNVFALL